MSISVDILASSACELGGRIYGHVGKDRTDCSRFVFAVLRDVYGAASIDPLRPHLLIHEGHGMFAPIQGIVAAGLGDEVVEPLPGRWHLCQGWRRGLGSADPSGHAWLWYETPTPTGLDGLILQATTSAPPWCKRLTWTDQAAPFKAGVRLAALRDY